jgi:hypothetical protein
MSDNLYYEVTELRKTLMKRDPNNPTLNVFYNHSFVEKEAYFKAITELNIIKFLLDAIPSSNSIDDRERGSQIEGRFKADCLCWINKEPSCSIHEVELDNRGICSTCESQEAEAAHEAQLAHLERMADCIAETDDDSTLEDNLPYYNDELDGYIEPEETSPHF